MSIQEEEDYEDSKAPSLEAATICFLFLAAFVAICLLIAIGRVVFAS